MASLTITAANVRHRLTDLTTADISDAVLGSPAFITTADSWMTLLLAKNGKTAATLTSDQGVIMVAAKIAFVCIRVVTKALREDFKTGIISSKRVTAKEYQEMVEILKAEIKECFTVCDFVLQKWVFTYSGGDDYHPSGEDNTNIDMHYASQNDPFFLGGGES